MTIPQLKAANRAKGASAGGIGRGFAALDVKGGSGESGRRLAGNIEGAVGARDAELVAEEINRGRNEARTREETYSTI